MARVFFLFPAAFIFFQSGFSHANPHTRASGEITDLALTFKLGTAPGLDLLDASGNWVLGSGHNGIDLPAEGVVFSFDNGRFIQALSPNSFVPISGGHRYTAPTGSSGITMFRINANGTFDIDVRKSDLSGLKTTAMGPMTITIGDDIFTVTPNSIPVGKISGPASAALGETVTLDASTSSDFNTESLGFTWSIVSQPLGSNVSLSSTNNPTTSFIPTSRGYYVVKVVPADPHAEGIPALITVMATGGADDPVPPPTPENGMITLSTDQTEYLVNEPAILNIHEDIQVGNGTNRYHFMSTLDDMPITHTVVPGSNVDNIHTTAPFTEAGLHTFKVDLYIENTNLAKQLANTIEAWNADIAAINAALVHEQDPEAIARLNAQKASDLEQISIAQQQIELNRTRVGETVVLQFLVN